MVVAIMERINDTNDNDVKGYQELRHTTFRQDVKGC